MEAELARRGQDSSAISQNIRRLEAQVLQLADADSVTTGQLVRMVWFCIISTTAAVCLSTLIPSAFTIPAPSYYGQDGKIDVTLTVDPNHRPTFGSTDGLVIEASFSAYADYASYAIYFPQQFAGRDFTIFLSGTAVLSEPSAGAGVAEAPGLSNVYGSCDEEGAAGYATSTCQVLSGVVEPDGVSLADDPPRCSVNAPAHSILVWIQGRMAQQASQVDWAHRQLGLPGWDDSAKNTRVIYKFAGKDYGFGYQEPPIAGCKTYQGSDDEEIVATSEDPASRSLDTLLWSGGDAATTSIITSASRDASSTGNLLLAAAGACFGLGVGFTPVAYEMSRRRRIRRLRT